MVMFKLGDINMFIQEAQVIKAHSASPMFSSQYYITVILKYV